MLTQFAQLYPVGLIRYTQTTFLELVTDTEVHRIDFRGKITSRLQRGTRGPVLFPQTRPLLNALHVPLTTLMARATTHTLADAPALLAAIREELHHHSDRWYNFHRSEWTNCGQCLTHYNILPNLTLTGGIILDSVSTAIAQAVEPICAYYSVETYFLTQLLPSPTPSPFQLLLVGGSYIIAREFFVSTLCGMPLHERMWIPNTILP